MARIEMIPNISEGRDEAIIRHLVSAVRGVPGAAVLDTSWDPFHHRMVLTAVGDSSALYQASIQLFEQAIALIDMRRHRGEHPRVGAVDVLPFVPLEGTSMSECVALARRVGEDVADRFGVPVYLYEYAAREPERRELPHLRKGGFEGLAEKMKLPRGRPDFGPDRPHPTAGVSIVGARGPLIAFNVNLGTDRLKIARTIARAVRQSNGGLDHVRAIGVSLYGRGQVQVSMNLTDYRRTPLHRALERVRDEAQAHGVEVTGSEIVGLAPLDAFLDAAAHCLRLEASPRDKALEERLRRLDVDPGTS